MAWNVCEKIFDKAKEYWHCISEAPDTHIMRNFDFSLFYNFSSSLQKFFQSLLPRNTVNHVQPHNYKFQHCDFFKLISKQSEQMFIENSIN